LAAILITSLVIGGRHSAAPPTPSQRAHAIAASLRCPSCSGESAADAPVPAAQAIRAEITRRVDLGQSDRQITNYFVSRYGGGIVLSPSTHGPSLALWVLPGLAIAITAAGLAIAFRRRRAILARPPDEEDRAMVDAALDARASSGQPAEPAETPDATGSPVA
jgi:cytochrome c-type biogenesis protein CcmH/NrfF